MSFGVPAINNAQNRTVRFAKRLSWCAWRFSLALRKAGD